MPGALNRSHWILILSVVLTITLYMIPVGRTIAYPLLLVSTLVHELGHGLVALLVGANFDSLIITSDGAGLAKITGEVSNTSKALIAAGGLLGPSVGALICFLLSVDLRFSRLALSVLGALLIVADCLYVRSLFGVAFTGGLAAIFLYIAQQENPELAQTSLVFVASQLALSVFSRSDYLFTPTVQTQAGLMPSDVGQIAEALFPPYWFWGGIIAILSGLILLIGMWVYIKKS